MYNADMYIIELIAKLIKSSDAYNNSRNRNKRAVSN